MSHTMVKSCTIFNILQDFDLVNKMEYCDGDMRSAVTLLQQYYHLLPHEQQLHVHRKPVLQITQGTVFNIECMIMYKENIFPYFHCFLKYQFSIKYSGSPYS